MIIAVGILIIAGSFAIGKIYGIFAGLALIWFALQFRESDARIRPAKITKIRDVNTTDELRGALADIHSPSYGRKGQHIGYRTTPKFTNNLRSADFDDSLDAVWALKHPHRRIELNYSSEEAGMDYPVGTFSDEEAKEMRKWRK